MPDETQLGTAVEERAFEAHGAALPPFPGMEPVGQEPGGHVMGVTVHAWLGGYPLRRWGEAWLSDGRMSLRYRRPLHVGDPLTLVVTDDADTRTLALVGPDGQPVATGDAAFGAGGHPDPASFVDAEAPSPKLRPAPEVLDGAVLGATGFPFDAARDLAFVGSLEDDEPWRQLPFAHPAWIATGVNALLAGSIDFHLERWVHAGVRVHSLRPIPSPSTIRLQARVERLFRRGDNEFADVAVLVLADGVPSMVQVATIVYR